MSTICKLMDVIIIPLLPLFLENAKLNDTMKKLFVTMMVFALTIGAKGQDDGMDALMSAMIAAKIHQDSIDTSNLVVVYDYECQTQDADGKAVTDRMKLCLQVGQHCTRCYPYRKFLEDTESYEYTLCPKCGRTTLTER